MFAPSDTIRVTRLLFGRHPEQPPTNQLRCTTSLTNQLRCSSLVMTSSGPVVAREARLLRRRPEEATRRLPLGRQRVPILGPTRQEMQLFFACNILHRSNGTTPDVRSPSITPRGRQVPVTASATVG